MENTHRRLVWARLKVVHITYSLQLTLEETEKCVLVLYPGRRGNKFGEQAAFSAINL